MQKKSVNAYVLTFVGVMAAMVYVVTLFRFPLLGSKVHFANAICLLAGMLLGPWWGGAAAGLGSALYDALAGGYDFINVLITFVSKFAMAMVCGILMRNAGKAVREEHPVRPSRRQLQKPRGKVALQGYRSIYARKSESSCTVLKYRPLFWRMNASISGTS